MYLKNKSIVTVRFSVHNDDTLFLEIPLCHNIVSDNQSMQQPQTLLCLVVLWLPAYDMLFVEQWRRHGGGGQAGQLPPTLSGVDFEISANPVRKLVR